MELTAELVALVIAVGVVAGLCDRFGWPTPLVLVVVGAAASFLPHLPEIRLDPELVGRGVEVGPVEDVGGGVKYAGFSDPDGNTLTLQEMPWRTGDSF